jgi:hypothetical protein
MKKKPYILPKNKVIEVSDPVYNFYRDEDERILSELILESMKDDKVPTKTYKKNKFHH